MNRAATTLFALAAVAAASTVVAADPVLSITVQPDGQVWAEYEGDGCFEFGGPFESVGDWRTSVSISESAGVAIGQVRIEEIAGGITFTVLESCIEGTLPRPITFPPTPPVGAEPGTPLPVVACPFGLAPAVVYVNGAPRTFEVVELMLEPDGQAVIYCRSAADHDRSGAVNVPDIFAFLGEWFAGSTRADVDASGHATVPDIFVFLAAWFS